MANGLSSRVGLVSRGRGDRAGLADWGAVLLGGGEPIAAWLHISASSSLGPPSAPYSCPRSGLSSPIAEGCGAGRGGGCGAGRTGPDPAAGKVPDHGAGLSPGETEERRVRHRDEGEDERGGADRPHETPPERLDEGEAAQPAAPQQPAARHPRHEGTHLLQGGESLRRPWGWGKPAFALQGA